MFLVPMVSRSPQVQPTTSAPSSPTSSPAPIDAEVRPPARLVRHLPVVVSLVLYAVLALAGYWQAWTQGPAGHVLSPGGDQADSMWFLTWIPYALLHGLNPLVSTYGNTPYGINLLVNTPAIPLDYLLAPVTLAFGPVVSFNLAGTLAPFASATAAFFFVRRFVRWQPAAFVGGLLYGFSPYVVGQGIGHINLEFVALPPLILLLVHDVVVRQTGRPLWRGTLLALLVVLQYFMSPEILLTTAMMAVAGTIVVALLEHGRVRSQLSFLLRAGGVAAVLSAVLLAYPLWVQFKGQAHVVGPLQQAPQVYRADLLGPIVPDVMQRFAPHAFLQAADRFAGNGSENGSYLGIPLLVLLVVGALALWRRRAVLVSAILAILAYLLSLGSHVTVYNHITTIPLPEGVLDKLPVVKNVVPARFALYVTLFGGVVLAASLDHLRRARFWSGTHRLSTAGSLLVGIAVLVPLVPRWPYTMVPVGTPSYFTSGAADAIPESSVAAVYPFPDELFANPQLWQASTFLRFKMPGGRWIVPAPGTGTFADSRPSVTDTVLTELAAGTPVPKDPTIKEQVVGELRSWRVQTVIAVPGGTDPPAAVAYLSWLLGSSPTESDGVFVWYHWH